MNNLLLLVFRLGVGRLVLSFCVVLVSGAQIHGQRSGVQRERRVFRTAILLYRENLKEGTVGGLVPRQGAWVVRGYSTDRSCLSCNFWDRKQTNTQFWSFSIFVPYELFSSDHKKCLHFWFLVVVSDCHSLSSRHTQQGVDSKQRGVLSLGFLKRKHLGVHQDLPQDGTGLYVVRAC